jgi:hypothetical protein
MFVIPALGEAEAGGLLDPILKKEGEGQQEEKQEDKEEEDYVPVGMWQRIKLDYFGWHFVINK